MIDLSLWRDISIVLLVLEIMILLTPIAVLLYFCNKYLRQGIKWLQNFLISLREIMETVQANTLKAGRSIISPFIAINRFFAAGKGMIRGALVLMRGK